MLMLRQRTTHLHVLRIRLRLSFNLFVSRSILMYIKSTRAHCRFLHFVRGRVWSTQETASPAFLKESDVPRYVPYTLVQS